MIMSQELARDGQMYGRGMSYPTRIDWAREHCQLLRAISAEFRQTRPFDGLTIGTGIHLEARRPATPLWPAPMSSSPPPAHVAC
jgi:S-adenosylhomocysteine hydrolase